MGSIGTFISTILHPLEWVVATIMVAFHTVLTTLGMPAASGLTWALSIVGLVIVIRIILIPLFVKQIKASRGMQLIQPEIQKIQKKYKGKTDPASRQAMTQETMALYKETGTNPFASCLPILLQSPIFFALYRVLRNIALPKPSAIGPFSLTLIHQANEATLFGARISDKFIGAQSTSTRILTITLIAAMSLSTFTTQRQLMSKNMPASAMDNPFARQQKMLMYVLPLFFAISGVNFPIGVLLYWLTTNVWSMGQQFYVIRRMPAPGSQAERELHERRARKGKIDPTAPVADDDAADGTDGAGGGQRQQPKRAPRGKRGPRPAGGDGDVTGGGDVGGGDVGGEDSGGTDPDPTAGQQSPGAGGPGARGRNGSGPTTPAAGEPDDQPDDDARGGAPAARAAKGKAQPARGTSQRKNAPRGPAAAPRGDGKRGGTQTPRSAKPR